MKIWIRPFLRLIENCMLTSHIMFTSHDHAEVDIFAGKIRFERWTEFSRKQPFQHKLWLIQSSQRAEKKMNAYEWYTR